MNGVDILSELRNELQAKEPQKKKKRKTSALSGCSLTAVAMEEHDETRQEAFSPPLQKRKQLAPDTNAAWCPKSLARFGFPFGAFRHNVKNKWRILMKNQCPETQLPALQMHSYWNKSRECVQAYINALFSVAFGVAQSCLLLMVLCFISLHLIYLKEPLHLIIVVFNLCWREGRGSGGDRKTVWRHQKWASHQELLHSCVWEIILRARTCLKQ